MKGPALINSGRNRTNVLEAEFPCLRTVESKLMNITCRMPRPRGSGTLTGLVEAVHDDLWTYSARSDRYCRPLSTVPSLEIQQLARMVKEYWGWKM